MANKILFFLLIIVFLLTTTTHAQIKNWVKNPSFESYTSIPPYTDGDRALPYDKTLDYCLNWSNAIYTSPSTFNYLCFAPTSGLRFLISYINPNPERWARSGYSLMRGWGDFNWGDTSSLTLNRMSRALLRGELNGSLISGRKYYLSYYVRLYSDVQFGTILRNNSTASNSLGAFVHKENKFIDPSGGAYSKTMYSFLDIQAQVQNDPSRYLSDTGAYMEISGWFTAQGGEQFITLGNFKTNFETKSIMAVYDDTTIAIGTNPNYLYDDVTLVEYPDLGADTCIAEGDSIVLSVPHYMNNPQGGFYWSTGAKNTRSIVVHKPDTYWVEFATEFTTVRDSIIISGSTSPVTYSKTIKSEFCNTNTATIALKVKQAQNIQWQNGATSPSIKVNASQVYTVQFDLNGCTYKQDYQVQFNQVSIDSIWGTKNGCWDLPGDIGYGDNYIKLKGQYDKVYWQTDHIYNNALTKANDGLRTDSFYATENFAGEVWINVTAYTGNCAIKDSFSYINHTTGRVNLGNDIAICSKDMSDLRLRNLGGHIMGAKSKILWSTGSTDSLIVIDKTDLYWAVVQTEHCTFSDTVFIEYVDSFELPNKIICENDSYVLDVSDYPFDPNRTADKQCYWFKDGVKQEQLNGKKSIVLSEPGVYVGMFRLLDREKSIPNLYCPQIQDTFTLKIDSVGQILPADTILCTKNITLKTIEEFDSYKWYDGSTNTEKHIENPQGNYKITVSRNGCVYQDEIYINNQSIKYQKTDDYINCHAFEGLKLEVITDSVNQIKWLEPTIDSGYSKWVEKTGAYTFRLSNDYCQVYDTITIRNKNSYALPKLWTDTSFCSGKIQLNIELKDSGQIWLSNQSNTITLNDTGVYLLQATNGCDTTQYPLTIRYEACDSNQIYIPNAFSPNGDGLNEEFKPSISLHTIVDYQLNIYSRKGNHLFQSQNINKGWDGKFRDKQCPSEAYYYTITYFDTATLKYHSYNGVLYLMK